MSLGTYALGIALLFLAFAPLIWGAAGFRRRIAPQLAGAPAALATAIVAVAVTLGVPHLLGAIGAFRRAPLVIAVAMAGLVLRMFGRGPGGEGRSATPPAPEPDQPDGGTPRMLRRTGIAAAVIAVAIVAGAATTHVGTALNRGITHRDSLTYHLPHAGRFVQDGWLTRIHFTDPDFPDAYHPSDGELIHAIGMLVVGRDVLSPAINIGWAALTVLAAWCVGLPYRREWLTTTAVALMLASPMYSLQTAGTASNDVPVLFFLLSTTAFLVRQPRTTATTILAGLAAGMAIGTKLTSVILVLALTVGVLLFWRKAAWRFAAAWAGALVTTGGFWYLRNLFRTGTPAPSVDLGVGPLPFTSPNFRVVDELGYSIADYIGNGDVWRSWFLPGLRLDLGWTWWLTLALAVGGAVIAIVRSRDTLVRILGGAAIISAIGYVFTPTTALGQPGEPLLFAANFIYLSPAIVLGLALLTISPALQRPRTAWVLLVAMALSLAISQYTSDIIPWRSSYRPLALAVAAAVSLTAVGAAALGRSPSTRRRAFRAGGLGLLVVLVVAWFPIGRAYVRDAYRADERWSWARDLEGARIAVVGFGPQYPYYGPRLHNYVQYLGQKGPNGEFTSIDDCSSWRTALRRERFTHVVLKPERDTTAIETRELPWTASDPGSRLLLREGEMTVYRFDPTVPDTGCPA